MLEVGMKLGKRSGLDLCEQLIMWLDPDTTLGSSSVTAKISAGGIGEAYRARDATLDPDHA